MNLGVYKPDLKYQKVIKDKIKNISKIIKELKNLKMAKKTSIKVRLVPENKPNSPFFIMLKNLLW